MAGLLAAAGVCQAGEPLRIASWNLEHLAAAEGTGCRPRSEGDYQRLRRYARRLDADVVALQEVENAEAVRRLFPAEHYRVEIGAGDHRPPRPCRGAAYRLLTDHRVAFAIRRDVPYRRLPDVELPAGGKPSPQIAVTVAGRPLHLLAVHLQSGCFTNRQDRRAGERCDALRAQADRVEAWIDRHSRAGRAAVALGDFNRRFTVPGDRVWKDLADGIPAPLTTLTRDHVQRCRGRYRGRPYIDHVVVNPAALALVRGELEPLVYRETGRESPSDHCPIAVTFGPPAP